MESLFLINPRKRKRRRKNPMPPALKAYWAKKRGGGRKRRKVRVKSRMANPRKRRRNPRRRRARARRRNPVYHRRRRKVYASRRRRHNPRAHRRIRHRHRRRNPFGSGEIKSVIIPGLIGAGGAIALSVLYGFATPYIPASFATGFFPTIIQAAGAIGIGLVAGKFLGRSAGNAAAIGALTVIAVNQITPLISSASSGSVPGISGFGGLKLGGVGDYVPYRRPIGAYMPGKVMPTGRRGSGMGFISPAPKIGAYMKRRGVGAYMPRVPMRGLGAADMSGGSGYNGLHDGM